MPRGLSLRAARVHQTATNMLQSQMISRPPIWYDTVGQIPPGELLVRTQPVQHKPTKYKSKVRKPSKLFKPQMIEYEEDILRKEFFKDHPWELARPRVVLEEDGRDGQKCDWSRMQQIGRPLNGESVVQRQLWLIHNMPGITQAQAYDKARKEFYALRLEEEIERRIAREEATWVGAYFHKGALEVGMELENRHFEGWKKWARIQISIAKREKMAGTYHEAGPEADEDAEELPAL